MNYSQNQEQHHILKYFGNFIGRLADVGANNGHTFSNTKALVDKGWGGICVEPSPGAFAALQLHHYHNDRIYALNAAIGTESGFATFYDGADSLVSSLIPEKTQAWKTPITEMSVSCLTWRDLLLLFPGPYDFINIDTEGVDWDILQQIDLTDTKLICVEYAGNEVQKYIDYCARFGMKEVYRCYENIIMGK